MNRRTFLRATALVGVVAGCVERTDDGTPTATTRTPPTPTEDTPTTSPPTEDTSTASPSPTPCSTETPEPTPDMAVSASDHLDDPVSVEIVVSRSSDVEETVYRDEFTLDPGESVDVVDVFPDDDTYRITASLPDGTSATAERELRGTDRYGILMIRVRSVDEVTIDRLNVVPEPTPTPCP